MATGKHYFIEQNRDNRYAARAKGSGRASSLFDTQKEALTVAQQLNPEGKPDVERFRNVVTGKRDQWRHA